MADESEEEPETLVEEQPEVVPSLASVDPECVEWVKSNVDLPGVRKTDLKWEPEHEETIAEFIASTAHRRLVFTGSHNWTGPSLDQNDETLLRVERDEVFNAFVADLARVRAAATRP